MKSKYLLGTALFIVCSAAFGQATDPAKTLKDINDYQAMAMKSSKTMADRLAVDATVKAKAQDAIKGVDITKVDPKTAFDWAKLFSIAKDNHDTCLLAQRYLTSHPDASKRYEAQMLMMDSCNSMGEGKMIDMTMGTTKPTNGDQNEEYTEDAVYELSDTIAAAEGPMAAYKSLKTAEDNLVAQTDPKADETRAAQHFEFKAKEAEFLARAGDKDQGLKLLDNFGKTLKPWPGIAKGLPYARNAVSVYGSAAPELISTKTFGQYSSLGSLKGKVVILDFFAHWCGPCKASFPDEAKMYSDLKDKGLELVGVTTFYQFYGKENRNDRKMTPEVEAGHMGDFVKEHNMAWPVILGDKSNFLEYGVTAIPHVVVIDRKGVVRDMEVGYDPDTFPAFRAKIEALLAQ